MEGSNFPVLHRLSSSPLQHSRAKLIRESVCDVTRALYRLRQHGSTDRLEMRFHSITLRV